MTGMLMPIGGGDEDSCAEQTLLMRFVQICGGMDARILIIPSASSISKEVAAEYEAIFTAVGAKHAYSFDFVDRHQANDTSAVELLNDVTGVFLTGGDQMKLLSLVGGTCFADALRSKFGQGIHISGTSAGASAMSRQMIGFGKSGFTVSPDMVHLTAGLGLSNNLIIDQHFEQRKRLGRLISAVMLNPGMLGIGLDEDTALIIAPDGHCEVIGSGSVTVVNQDNAQNAHFSRTAYETAHHEYLAIYKLQTGTKIFIPQAAYGF